MMAKPMADSVAYLPEMDAWYNTITEELAQIDLNKLLVYLVDMVDASALPYLGAQFDVLGYKGFRLANTEADMRAIIKRAIELHRYKGTEWAIEEALKSIGFADVALIKTGYDHWAKFGILITNESVQLTDSSLNDITQMVLEYKRAVCVLMEIRLTIQVSDVLFVDDADAMVNKEIDANDVLIISGALFYDGSAEFNGEHTFSGDGDVVTITQI
jgi:P2-related tail formation protein